MSFINGSQLAGLNSNAEYPLQRQQNESAQSDMLRRQPSTGDGYQNTPIALPIAYPGSSSSPSSSSDTNFFSSIVQNLTNAISQIRAYLAGQSATTGTGSTTGIGTGTPTGTGCTANPTQTQQPENYFASATASSTGDPHDAFSGTTGGGASVSDKWDSMTGHGDLLDSNSFRGGYQVSTTTTTPNANGVTYNASATVATDGGKSSVTMNKDGSYVVTENGRNVTLTQGQATQIGRNETVTLNADRSLTIADTNHQGGTLTTTLSNNGNGVDVNASGTGVDLGGYLVNKTESTADPIANQPQSPPPWFANGSMQGAGSEPWLQTQYGSNQTQSYNTSQFGATQSSPLEYGNDTEPLGAGEIEYA